MDRDQAPAPAGKLTFLVLTFALSSAVIFGLAAASGRPAAGVTTAGMAGAAMGQPHPASPSRTDDSGRVMNAQRGDDRDIALPPGQKKGAESSLIFPNIADIAESANAAVVNIRATEIIRPGSRRQGENPHGPFEFFFPRPDGRSPHGPQGPQGPQGDEEDDDQRQDSGGSGFIVSEDGYVMTNYHVIEEADKVIVQLADDSFEYQARIIGTDPTTDLALLKIEPRGKLPTIPLGDSERLRVGDWVIAIGNPLAYDHTVTVGVVSAKGRKLRGLSRDVSLDNYIQTDAAINRGNSGGPLLNVKGEAVGINSAISVAGQGISFAIPINMARDVMAQLRDKGRVSRGFLGVQIADIQTELSPQTRTYFGLDGRKGAFIQSVTKDQPAERAGLKKGDAIVMVDGQSILGSDDLIHTISGKPPGAQVSLGIVRDGRERTLTAELIDRPDQVARASREEPGKPPDDPVADRRLGVTVEDLTPRNRQEYRIDPDLNGVVVTHVAQVSGAWEEGLREGDVIVEANRQPITSLDAYRALIDKMKPGDIMALYVRSPQDTTGHYVAIRVGAE